LKQEFNTFKSKVGLDDLNINDKQLDFDTFKLFEKMLSNPKDIPKIIQKMLNEFS